MIVCVTCSKLHRSAMKVRSVASKSCYKGKNILKSNMSTGPPVHTEAYLPIQVKNNNNKIREDKEILMCAPELNELYNHSVHKEFGK